MLLIGTPQNSFIAALNLHQELDQVGDEGFVLFRTPFDYDALRGTEYSGRLMAIPAPRLRDGVPDTPSENIVYRLMPLAMR